MCCRGARNAGSLLWPASRAHLPMLAGRPQGMTPCSWHRGPDRIGVSCGSRARPAGRGRARSGPERTDGHSGGAGCRPTQRACQAGAVGEQGRALGPPCTPTALPTAALALPAAPGARHPAQRITPISCSGRHTPGTAPRNSLPPPPPRRRSPTCRRWRAWCSAWASGGTSMTNARLRSSSRGWPSSWRMRWA